MSIHIDIIVFGLDLVRSYEEFMGWNLKKRNFEDQDFANGTPTLIN